MNRVMQKDRFHGLCTKDPIVPLLRVFYCGMVVCAFLLLSSRASYQATLQCFEEFVEGKGKFF